MMRVWIGVGIFLGVFIIAFAIFALRTTEGPAPAPDTASSEAAITNVKVTDAYVSKTGLHAIRGTATVPDACTPLSATTSISAASSTVIRVDLSAESGTGVCLELPTEVSFSVTSSAPKDDSVEVYANGALSATAP
jgi:hypothetical protein